MCIVFVTAGMGAVMNASMTVVSVLFTIFMNALEVLVAFLQAYVFTMLSGVFIGLVLVAFLQAYVFTMLSGVFIGLAQEGKTEKKVEKLKK